MDSSAEAGPVPLPHYTGPYERWIFSAARGRPFAFPAIANGPSRYYAALAEGGVVPGMLGGGTSTALRLPPLWNPGDGALEAVPFVLYRACGGLQEYDGDGPCPDVEVTLAGQAGGAGGARYRLNYPVAEGSWVGDYDESAAFAGWTPPDTPPRVIVAVIDDGVPFAHRAFLDGTGRSRISHCWLQSAAARPGPAAVPFGREFGNAQIDGLRARHPDETQLYREASAIDAALPDLGLYLRGKASHGAHIAGLSAGNDPRLPGAVIDDDVQVIAVQLPNTVAWDTSGFGKEMFMLSALHYIFSRARAIAARYPDGPEELPLVVNFSYGWSANRHDGGAAMERAFQQLLARRQQIQPATALNMPMGNNFEKRMHAQFTRNDLSAGAGRIGWWLSPDDMTSSYLEIWFPEGFDAESAHVSVAPPPGAGFDSSAKIDLLPNGSLGQDPRRYVDIRIDGQIVAQLSADLHFGERWRVLLALIPTTYTAGQMRRAPAGEWRIRIACPHLGEDEAVNVWLQRDDDPGVLRSGGRQSHLVAPVTAGQATGACDAGLGILRGFGTFNGISSAAATIRVAGYVENSRLPSRFSGAGGLQRRGDQLEPWSVGPAFAAPADQGRSRPGLPSIGVLSGSGARLQGTSAAAAVVTRWMVCNLTRGRGMTDGLAPLPPPSCGNENCPSCAAKLTARLGRGLVPLGPE